VRAGKVRYLGASHLPAWRVVDALWLAGINHLSAFIACEDEYSVLARGIERELIPALRAHGLGLLPYYPLASGMLTGKYKRGQPFPPGSRFATIKERDYPGRFVTQANWTRIERLTAFAQARGHRLLELAMSWLLANPLVSCVIVGATKAEQLQENVRASNWPLTREELDEIDPLCG
jgi:aryl-alcohol dehydrogenase-like predicted oxidoreductase